MYTKDNSLLCNKNTKDSKPAYPGYRTYCLVCRKLMKTIFNENSNRYFPFNRLFLIDYQLHDMKEINSILLITILDFFFYGNFYFNI